MFKQTNCPNFQKMIKFSGKGKRTGERQLSEPCAGERHERAVDAGAARRDGVHEELLRVGRAHAAAAGAAGPDQPSTGEEGSAAHAASASNPQPVINHHELPAEDIAAAFRFFLGHPEDGVDPDHSPLEHPSQDSPGSTITLILYLEVCERNYPFRPVSDGHFFCQMHECTEIYLGKCVFI